MIVATETVDARAGAPTAIEGRHHVRGRAHAVGTGFAAFGMYLVVSVLQWGLPVVGHLGSRYAAAGRGDPDFYRWALAWTPWAIAHARNPVFTDAVFAPHGVSLAWTAFVPGPALVLWPVTKLFGTLVSYNVGMLLAPPLAAWGAFLVCRRINGSFWPSLVGGALFGACASVAAQMQGHLNLVLVFPIPLGVYLVIRRVEGSLGARSFLAWMGVVLLGLFSISIELFATTALFGALAFVLAIGAAGPDRRRVIRAGTLTGLAFVIVGALVLVPYLGPVFREAPPQAIRPIDRASTDLLGPIVPREGTLIGGSSLSTLSDRFTAHPAEDGGYLGLALVAMVVAFGITERGRRGTWALLAFVGITFVLALGPTLHVLGRGLFALPGRVLQHLPLVKDATPDRFPLYASLAVGAIASIWLARSHGRRAWMRWALVGLGGVMLVQTTSSPPWHLPDRTPAFFTDGAALSVLDHDENVLLVTASNGEEMAMQAATGFWFRMPEGYIGRLPEDVRIGPLSRGLEVEGSGAFVPQPADLARWLTQQGVTAVVVTDPARSTFEQVVAEAGFRTVFEGDGVSVWRSAPTPGSRPGA